LKQDFRAKDIFEASRGKVVLKLCKHWCQKEFAKILPNNFERKIILANSLNYLDANRLSLKQTHLKIDYFNLKQTKLINLLIV